MYLPQTYNGFFPETKANESPVIPKGSVDELAKQTVITACDVIEAGGSAGASSLRMQDHLRTRSELIGRK